MVDDLSQLLPGVHQLRHHGPHRARSVRDCARSSDVAGQDRVSDVAGQEDVLLRARQYVLELSKLEQALCQKGCRR